MKTEVDTLDATLSKRLFLSIIADLNRSRRSSKNSFVAASIGARELKLVICRHVELTKVHPKSFI